ncbi:hypothetical protein KKJ05_15445 [Xenorhabdus bovienii]|nr:hypothetical protein [Xenorhabdus bovienii]
MARSNHYDLSKNAGAADIRPGSLLKSAFASRVTTTIALMRPKKPSP